jgi:hypothetical protein
VGSGTTRAPALGARAQTSKPVGGGPSQSSATPGGTVRPGLTSNTGVDDDERQALQTEGLDPNDPAVIAAIDLVRWELSLAALIHQT